MAHRVQGLRSAIGHRTAGWSRTAGVAAAAVALGCAGPPPDAPPLAEFEAAERKQDIVRLTGLAPARCGWSRPGMELCTWRLANRNSAWWTLAPTVGTEYQVNLVCEFPSDGSPRARACNVYPRKSRSVTRTPSVASAGASSEAAQPSPELGAEEARSEAQRQLDAAETVAQMTALVGDAPDRCATAADGEQRCFWTAGNQTLGYELLAATIGASKRVQLDCSFPGDGGPRAPGSCRVVGP